MFKSLLFLLCAAGLYSQRIQPCSYNTSDMVTKILPGFASSVQPCSYAGLAPLDNNNNSALFYWYFPAQINSKTAPFLIWLQGGPGASSLFGLFTENGPFRIIYNTTSDIFQVFNIDEQQGQSWSYYYNVLWLDSPVGAGFSYTTANSSVNEDQVVYNIWKALQYFLKIQPETLTMKWYYTGESYAGRYIPSAAYWTLKYNDNILSGKMAGLVINLKGVMIGGAFVHGLIQRVATIEASMAANLLGPNQVPQAKALAVNCERQVANNMSTARITCNSIDEYISDVSGVDVSAISLPANITNSIGNNLQEYLNNFEVYSVLHVQNSKKKGPFFDSESEQAYTALSGEIVANNSLIYVNYVLRRIPCLLFEGNFDAGDGSIGTYKWVPLLEAPYPNILNTTRNIWFIQGIPAGFWTKCENFTLLVVDFSGHYTPYFVLDATIQMIKAFTLDNQNWDPYGTRLLSIRLSAAI